VGGVDFPAFAVTVDLVVLTVRAERLCALVVRRGEEPFLGALALPGGFVRPEEDLPEAAARELAEETGVRVSPERLVGPVWRRTAVFSFDGHTFTGEEEFFVAFGNGQAIDTSGFSVLEADTTLGHRWWSGAELRDTGEVIYPRQLGELLGQIHPDRWDGVTRPVS
jgi:ADP-ribose pyrophosphatase YjhB (NUDIX family)